MTEPHTKPGPLPWEGRPATRAAYWWQSIAEALANGEPLCQHQQAFADRAAKFGSDPLPWETKKADRYWWENIGRTVLAGQARCTHQAAWMDAVPVAPESEPMPMKAGPDTDVWWWSDIIETVLVEGDRLCRHQAEWLADHPEDDVAVVHDAPADDEPVADAPPTPKGKGKP